MKPQNTSAPSLGNLALEMAKAGRVRQTAHGLCPRVTHRHLATPFVVTPDCRHRLDAIGVEYADPRGQGLALVPPAFSKAYTPHLFTTQPVSQVQHTIDRLGLMADAQALAVQNRDAHTESFRWVILDAAGRVAMQVVHNPYRCEGGDIVWGPPCARCPDSSRGPRPAHVPPYRVVERWEDLYSDDTGPFLFMGYGEGNDYRTKRAALEEMARLGVVVIGVNLANAPSAQRDLPYMDGNTPRVLSQGTFFHLDTVFRPTPHGAFVFADALPEATLTILRHLYGPSTIIPLDTADCVRFACNGRLLRQTDDTMVLFYKAGALPRDKVNAYAAAVGGTVRDEPHDGYDVWVMEARDDHDAAQILRFVPVPTEEVWKGGGSFSCITQLVPSNPESPGPVRLVMAPPAHYKPSPEDALNALERELIASLSVKNAWREFETTQCRVRAEGFTVIEMALTPGFEEQIYTRDGTDGYLLRGGQLLDPAVHRPEEGDCYLVWESNIPDGPRRQEPAAMSQELVNVRLGKTVPPRVRSPQWTDTILMVRPVDFTFNEQTGVDNVFQHAVLDPEGVRQSALQEFTTMVHRLRQEGVTVLVLEGRNAAPTCPDAVFPNNWISVEHDGTVVVYPMRTPNRQAETSRLGDVRALMQDAGYAVGNTVQVQDAKHHALEGTGSLIIDHTEDRFYAALSERCDEGLVRAYAHNRGYKEPVLFHTQDSHGTPFYHTNVMMSLGNNFAVVCSAAIPDANERARVLARLAAKHHIIDITLEQTETHFCANILQICNNRGEPLIVMSQNAHDGFTPAQRQALAVHGKLVAVDINIIEHVGGGSARCMMAQVFAPKRAA